MVETTQKLSKIELIDKMGLELEQAYKPKALA